MQQSEWDNFYWASMTLGLIVFFIGLYYFSFPVFRDSGMSVLWIDQVIARFYAGGIYRSYLYTKLFSMALIFAGCMKRTAKGTDLSWGQILAFTAATIIVYLFPPITPKINLVTSIVGVLMCLVSMAMIQRKITRLTDPSEDIEDSFEQCEQLVENEHSINIPTLYRWKGRSRHGWINVVNPFRASIVLGTPGSGKSFSVYGPFIEQMVAKHYTMFVYDYKFPDLSESVYNELVRQCYDIRDGHLVPKAGFYHCVTLPDGQELLHRYKADGKTRERPMVDERGEIVLRDDNPVWVDVQPNEHPIPQFYCINFSDPRYSHRSNPINAKYIQSGTDATEIANLVMENVNKGKQKGADDFFSLSAKVYLDAIVYFLSIYDPDKGTPKEGTRKGCYCTFPHVIELMGTDYRKVFRALLNYPELEVKIGLFASALKDKAMEQLQGQIASAKVPLLPFATEDLYWTLSGDDFTLDVNNPDFPKIICIGNDPDRQSIYSTTLALFTSRMFRLINHKGKLPCGVLLDEMPTIYLKGIDQLIATARSNKVAILIGAQDKSQLTRDYTREEADVIFNTVGNVFSGQVSGVTAKEFADAFGEEWRQEQSVSEGDSSSSVSTTYRLQKILPASRIESLSQGTFFGKVADNINQKIRKKFFLAEIQIDMEEYARKQASWIKMPRLTDLGTDDPSEIYRIKKANYDRIKREVAEIIAKEMPVADEREKKEQKIDDEKRLDKAISRTSS